MQNSKFDFQKDVIQASKGQPVVVDFWAEWCGPCRILGPLLEKLANEDNGNWTLVKVNTEEHPQLAMQYRIQGIPAVKMFYNGEVTAEFVGALPETQVRKWLETHLPSESKNRLAKANEALRDGDKVLARKLFEEAWKKDENNYEAKVRLAELLFESDPAKAASLVKATPEEHPLYKNAEAIKNLCRLIHDYETLAQKAKQSGFLQNAWRIYLSAIESLRRHRYEDALKKWIDALGFNREIDDDGPRRACIALFTWLGPQHKLTKKYHRAFTSALF